MYLVKNSIYQFFIPELKLVAVFKILILSRTTIFLINCCEIRALQRKKKKGKENT